MDTLFCTPKTTDVDKVSLYDHFYFIYFFIIFLNVKHKR